MSASKAPGADTIPPEVFKSGGSPLLVKLTELYQTFRLEKILPQEFKDATIVQIFNGKGKRRSCGYHRGILLVSIARKILAHDHVLLKHLQQYHLIESQCTFRAGGGTIDMIFTARQL